jgi:hypothetical protein
MEHRKQSSLELIFKTLEEELKSHYFFCATAKQMWAKLDATFGKTTAWTMQEFLNEFYGMALEPIGETRAKED